MTATHNLLIQLLAARGECFQLCDRLLEGSADYDIRLELNPQAVVTALDKKHEPLFAAVLDSKNPRLNFLLWDLAQELGEFYQNRMSFDTPWNDIAGKARSVLEDISASRAKVHPARADLLNEISDAFDEFWGTANAVGGHSPLADVHAEYDSLLEHVSESSDTALLFALHWQVSMYARTVIDADRLNDYADPPPPLPLFDKSKEGECVDDAQEVNFWRRIFARIEKRVVTLCTPAPPMPPLPPKASPAEPGLT